MALSDTLRNWANRLTPANGTRGLVKRLCRELLEIVKLLLKIGLKLAIAAAYVLAVTLKKLLEKLDRRTQRVTVVPHGTGTYREVIDPAQ